VRAVILWCGRLLAIVVLYVGITGVQVVATSTRQSNSHADAIVVFGTAENNGVPSDYLQARLDKAVQLWDLHRAPLIVVTGGKRPGDIYTEAGVSRTYLLSRGVPSTSIYVGSGADTWQNVSSVSGFLHRLGVHVVLTVTNDFHELRAMAILRDRGFLALPSPVRVKAGFSATWHSYARETVAVSVGRVIGFDRLSSWTQERMH
jgi:uncharacterized SAM-binding protein YcdF (DUF218 family)